MTSRHFESHRLTIIKSAALLAFSALLAAPAGALPLYASREGKTCVTCHIEPNGSGMRNDFGFNYGKNRHSMGVEEKWSNVTVDPQLNDWIRLGLDMRFMYYRMHEQGTSNTDPSTFFPMEGQLRVAITPYDDLTLVGTQGIVVQSPGFPAPYIARELYALFNGLPHGGFVQVGRFRLPFGLRQEDHTSFVRESVVLPYDSQVEDAGIEVGAVGSDWFGQFSFTNGGAPFNQRASTFAGKIGRASRAFQFGLSGYVRTYDVFQDEYRWSAYASATRGPVTVLGEYVADGFGGNREVEGAFGEVVYRASRGVNLRGKVDYFERPGGFFVTAIGRRYIAEIDLNPMPFTEFKLSYRRYNYDNFPDINEYFAMLFIPF